MFVGRFVQIFVRGDSGTKTCLQPSIEFGLRTFPRMRGWRRCDSATQLCETDPTKFRSWSASDVYTAVDVIAAAAVREWHDEQSYVRRVAAGLRPQLALLRTVVKQRAASVLRPSAGHDVGLGPQYASAWCADSRSIFVVGSM